MNQVKNLISKLKKINLNSKWITLSFLVIVFYYIFKYFKNNINDLQDFQFSVKIPILVYSGLLMWLAMFLNAYVYHRIVASLDRRAKLWSNIRIWFYSYLGRFFPGKVGLVASRLYLHKKQGISGRIAMFAFYLETLVAAITTLFIYLLSTVLHEYSFLKEYRFFSYLLLAACFVALHPGVIKIQLKLLMKIKGDQQNLDFRLNYFELIYIFVLRVFIWAIMGLGLYLIINAFYPISTSYLPYITGLFAIGTIVGLFAVFAPAGLGVIEGILLLGLKDIVPDGIAVVISIAMRIVKVISELSIIFLTYGIVRIFKLSNDDHLMNLGNNNE